MPLDGYFIPACLECNCDMRRVFSPPTLHLWGEGYHHYGLGERVTSDYDLKEKMKKKSAEVSARTGIETEYSIP